MDFIAGLPQTSSRHNAIWIIVNILTKSTHFLAMKTTNSFSRLIELYIQEIIYLHGIPIFIISD